MSQPSPRYEPPKPWLKAPPKEIAICVGIISLLLSILAPVFQQAQNAARQVSCQGSVRSLGSAMLQYATDNNDSLPPAAQWQSASSSYLKEEKGPCTALSHPAPGVLGYAMDSRLSGRSLERIGAPHNQRILLYESSNLTQNAHDPGTSFIVRHGYGAITFIDGHGRMQKQEPGELVVRKGYRHPMSQPQPSDKPPHTIFRQNYVEIYVGVAILAILAAILIPILQKSSSRPTPRPSASHVEVPRQ
ncbi:hypothetical protein [Armatimonas sp.]|uniref:hypothetical protein n=1 Tax=Armatimonas sp. TaxID=1872638 RepID=UPI00286CD91D|nr:hypothetical protein [Armatimonas sp.]